jgi:hypothetical protein
MTVLSPKLDVPRPSYEYFTARIMRGAHDSQVDATLRRAPDVRLRLREKTRVSRR